MMLNNDSIELIEENLNTSRINTICQHINLFYDKIWCVSLRKCIINNVDFDKLIRSLKKCKTIKYLNFNISFINSIERLGILTSLINNLSYLDTLSIHSSNIGDDGFKMLYYSLINLKYFRSLDIGNCQLSDNSIFYLRELIHSKETQKGLIELVLSSNPKITSIGWSKILIAVAASTQLKYLHIDYNNLDDSCGYLIAAILCSNQSIQVLDLEQTGLGDKSALLLLYLIKNYKLNLKSLNLVKNPIDLDLLNEINNYIKSDYDMNYNIDSNHESNTNINKITQMNSNDLNKNEISGLKFKDQLKLDKLIQKASKINLSKNNNNSYNKIEYQREDLIDLDESETNKNKQRQNEDSDFLNAFDDLRFKTHSVQPFNFDRF